jgi:hypothetical protein
MKKILFLAFFLTFSSVAQVLDVNGDNTVGAEEALAVAENWKGVASASDAHDHLGQTWEGNENPLIVGGYFKERLRRVKTEKGIQLRREKTAPLMLDNDHTLEADLRLQGIAGVIAAEEDTNSEMSFRSNRSFTFVLDADQAGFEGGGSIQIRDGGGLLRTLITDEGNIFTDGNIDADGTVTGSNLKIERKGLEKGDGVRVYYPLMVATEETFLLSGRAVLGEGGRALIHIPDENLADLEQSHFQLTPMGSPAPNIHIAKILHDETGFEVAGGREGQEVFWQMTGRGAN